MKTVTISLPAEFVDATRMIDYAKSLMYAYCGECGEDINGHLTKYRGERYSGAIADHWNCQGCEVAWCDDCVSKTTHEDDDRPDGFLCRCCAETEAAYQRCEADGCEHYKWDDNTNWECHEGLGDKVMCPSCEVKITAEERKKCADTGCDACGEDDE